jgi:6-methylsalicylic acid synthase
MVRDVDEDSLRRVMRPKVAGAQTLHALFPPGSLDFLLLFSSCGYLLGLTGQTSYAAGNAYLDGLARYRAALGADDTMSLGWTSWRGLGMSTSSAVIDAELAAHGAADITAQEAFSALELAERCSAPYLAVVRVLPDEPASAYPRITSELVEEAPESADCSEAWQSLPADELRAFLVDAVRDRVADEMRMPASDLDVRRPLSEMGLDSVMTVVIRRGLERAFRVPLPATILWDRPTVTAVADFLATELLGDAADGIDGDGRPVQGIRGQATPAEPALVSS